jgi:hypothetical protein
MAETTQERRGPEGEPGERCVAKKNKACARGRPESRAQEADSRKYLEMVSKPKEGPGNVSVDENGRMEKIFPRDFRICRCECRPEERADRERPAHPPNDVHPVPEGLAPRACPDSGRRNELANSSDEGGAPIIVERDNEGSGVDKEPCNDERRPKLLLVPFMREPDEIPKQEERHLLRREMCYVLDRAHKTPAPRSHPCTRGEPQWRNGKLRSRERGS